MNYFLSNDSLMNKIYYFSVKINFKMTHFSYFSPKIAKKYIKMTIVLYKIFVITLNL